jgi:DNA-binding transcriptional regulator YhcF (GntR family)
MFSKPFVMKTNPFDQLNLVAIEECSGIPKYEQIVKIILSDIENGIFKRGEQIPSINETSFEFYISRDTVEKAYKKLKELGAIISVRGKGYFVSERTDLKKDCMLMITETFNEKVNVLYSGMRSYLDSKFGASLFLHVGNPQLLKQTMKSQICNYKKYFFISDGQSISAEMKDALNSIPKSRLLRFENNRFSAEGIVNTPVIDSKQLYCMMDEILQGPFKHMLIVAPGNNLHFGVMDELINYGLDNALDFRVTTTPDIFEVKKGDLFIAWEQEDLIYIIKKCRENDLEPGRDVGIICFSELSVCEVMSGGITCIVPEKDSLNKAFSYALGLRNIPGKISFIKVQGKTA